ncbi:MAG: hypothetical protein QM768_19255 [Agriterribacter sp.]
MKQLPLIAAGLLIYCACNESPHRTVTNQTRDTNVNSEVSDPVPGMGYDPTRNDVTKRNALGAQGTIDSTGSVNNASPTPGLGNDPTRNNLSNESHMTGDKNKHRDDTVIKGD